jgi:nitronate monooxygenase
MIKPFENEFTKTFGCRYPIIAAPMFLVSDEKLVAAACEAGGVGTFPALNFRPIENYRKAIQTIKSKTQGPFGINIIVQKANKYQEQHLDIALEEKVPILITSLGNPRDVIKRAHEAGTKVFCDVVGLKHAKKVADYGADGLIAVSSGAGGHAGDISAFALIPQLKKNINLPIIAAGAISGGAGMAAAFSLGASAIYMGTRFIASKEAPVSDEYKRAITGASSEDIVNTDRVDGFPGNFILTESLKKFGVQAGFVETVVNQSSALKRALSLYRAGKVLLGNPEKSVSYKTIFSAGHGVSLIDEVLSVQEIIERTMLEYQQVKSRLP